MDLGQQEVNGATSLLSEPPSVSSASGDHPEAAGLAISIGLLLMNVAFGIPVAIYVLST